MKNLKITLENGKCHLKLNSSLVSAVKHAKNIRFNNCNLPYAITIATEDEVLIEERRLRKNNEEFETSTYNQESEVYICPNTKEFVHLDGELNIKSIKAPTMRGRGFYRT